MELPEAASILLSEMARVALPVYMSDLSEQYYFAGWLIDWEYTCWDALVNPTAHVGIPGAPFSDEERDTLDALWRACNEWPVPQRFDGSPETISMSEWGLRYRAWREKQDELLAALNAAIADCYADGGHNWAPTIFQGRYCACGASEPPPRPSQNTQPRS